MTLTLALLTLHNFTHARVSVGSCALIINVSCYRPLDGSLPMFTDLRPWAETGLLGGGLDRFAGLQGHREGYRLEPVDHGCPSACWLGWYTHVRLEMSAGDKGKA